MIRDTIKAAQITAMKAGEKDRLAAVRLILAKIKDRDIELRTASQQPDDDALVVEVLQKMVKQIHGKHMFNYYLGCIRVIIKA